MSLLLPRRPVRREAIDRTVDEVFARIGLVGQVGVETTRQCLVRDGGSGAVFALQAVVRWNARAPESPHHRA
ncbi:MAG: hypothetical protein HKL99_00200 [Burkholderiales bacterium]|nr:hypothetical protein [Burkholderiales bacterium]